MPYINQEERRYTDEHGPDNAGQLTYVLTKVLLFYLKNKGVSFKTFAEIIGALECTKQEWYDKMIRPYEDIKEQENGTVYPALQKQTLDIPSQSILTP